MGEVVYVSKVRIERLRGPLRRATLPAEERPVFFSTHGAINAHYGFPEEGLEPHAATLDYVVAAAGG